MPFAARLAIAALLLLLPGLAGADVLVSASGDRLTGKLVERRDGLLVFDSDLLGRIEVPAEAARVQPDPPATASAAPDPVAPAATPAPKVTRPSTDLGIRLSVDRGSLETPEEDFRVSLKRNRPTRHGVIRTAIDYRHKRSNDDLKDNDWQLRTGYERFLDEEHFVAGRALMTRELTSAGYDQTEVALLAAGWRTWEGEHQYLRIGPSLAYLRATRSQQQLDAGALGLYASVEGPAWAGLRFGGELTMLDTLGDGRYANLELRLRQPLGERLFLALVWEYAWSDFDIEPGVRSEWRWDLGWRFGPGASR